MKFGVNTGYIISRHQQNWRRVVARLKLLIFAMDYVFKIYLPSRVHKNKCKNTLLLHFVMSNIFIDFYNNIQFARSRYLLNNFKKDY